MLNKTPCKSYFRPEIDQMSGYTPGEQPKISGLIKLNTNENPFPPPAAVVGALREFSAGQLRLYPDPTSDALRDTIAGLFEATRANVIAGNGSDDILTIVFRSFTDSRRGVACLSPTYSLYPVLAQIQGAECREIPLNADFSLPDDLIDQAADANLLIICRPNAPTGNLFPKSVIRNICRDFDGIVLIDEAYVDFAPDNCIEFATEFENVIVCRTLSKSYSLAGLRLGYALAAEPLIEGMMKVKDSYNINRLNQELAIAALNSQDCLNKTVRKVCDIREYLSKELAAIGFDVVKSAANFVFAAPPDGDGESFFKRLRENAVLVRYFPGEVTGRFVRITIGAEEQIKRLLECAAQFYK